jgi:hypothetical protein
MYFNGICMILYCIFNIFKKKLMCFESDTKYVKGISMYVKGISMYVNVFQYIEFRFIGMCPLAW